MALQDYLQISERRLHRLAKATGIDAPRLHEISASNRATALELMKLADALGVSTSDLARPEPSPQRAEFRFRAAAKQSSTSSRVNQRTISEIAARIDGINEVVELGDQISCNWIAPQEVRQDPFALASWFRASCFGGDQVSPMLQLARLLDSCLGVIIAVLKRSDVDGVCAVVDGTPYVFIRAQYKPRMLFTLAHELGHLLAHATGEDYASLDPIGSVSRHPQTALEEGFANAFAVELLLPRSGVGVALQQIRRAYRSEEKAIGDIEILLLSHLFGVSFEVTARRCESLELLPRGGARSLVEFITREFGSPDRRANEIGLPDRPELEFPSVSANVLRAASRAISEGEVSIGRVLDRLRIDVSALLEGHKAVANESYH